MSLLGRRHRIGICARAILFFAAIGAAGGLLAPKALCRDYESTRRITEWSGKRSTGFSSRRSEDNKAEEPKAKATPAPAENAAPAGKTAPAAKAPTVARRTTPKPSSSRPRTSSSKPSTTGGSLKLPDIARSNVLYLSPSDARLSVGRKFSSAVIFSNPKLSKVDEFRIILKYNSFALMPMGVSLGSGIKPYLATPDAFKAKGLTEDGLLVIDIACKGLPAVPIADVARIEWKALSPSELTEIDFVSKGAIHTAATFEKKTVLGDVMLESTGLVGASYKIVPDEVEISAADAPLTEDLNVYGYDSAYGSLRDAAISLRLQGPTSAVKPDEPFFVDVILENPMGARMDALNLVIEFNPDTLKVLDFDEGNWIASGLNIFDGDSHDLFPFDYHIKNQAYNSLGEIYYMVGTMRPDAVFPTGKIASILFEPKKAGAKTEIAFRVAEQSIDRGVEVAYLGNDVLAKEGKGLHNASVTIAP